jgi:hypothetical protein
MDLSGLSTLKQQLVDATDFAPVWDYFMTNFGEDPAFMALGERAHCPLLEAIIPHVGQSIFQKKVPVANLLLTRLPEQQFIHGGFMLNGKLATVFYFEDLGVGLLTVALSFAGNTRLVRFTTRPLSGGGDLVRH